MKVLIIKLNATGDVVRTTSLLRVLTGEITWVTARNNLQLLENLQPKLNCICWGTQAADDLKREKFDLIINLEDEVETATFARAISATQRFGAYLDTAGKVRYSNDSALWFDLSIISAHGRVKADELKFTNRRSYQDLIFTGLGYSFSGERYLLPRSAEAKLTGDVAISPVAGPVWPMKNWAYFDELKIRLEGEGLSVNFLPRRETLLQHLADIKGHRCLVSGDSLPMHLALGEGIQCVTLFNCTSPWEIYDYGIQCKIVSPLLAEFFYKRSFDIRATTAIPLETVLVSVKRKLSASDSPHHARRVV